MNGKRREYAPGVMASDISHPLSSCYSRDIPPSDATDNSSDADALEPAQARQQEHYLPSRLFRTMILANLKSTSASAPAQDDDIDEWLEHVDRLISTPGKSV
ncbi:hypothetical protein EUZ85_11140 [Hahella sp. KA22]|uniref:hypothetical protein n=1 Tax=Hahella sp. KA22 TaxID=1628392 RepID=UPI000FDE00E7|nr:hypothetical protein [Hahella sp. KA22]AZZ91252.1 hypothetical protein ENC22_08585 [Hahella sp. KA22]QAY54620.1 hypothetical protein EUZ85_11140 [Hahella sp. KA22]